MAILQRKGGVSETKPELSTNAHALQEQLDQRPSAVEAVAIRTEVMTPGYRQGSSTEASAPVDPGV